MIETKQKKIKENSIVEIITLNSIRVIGLVNYNENNIIELTDPCIIEIKKRSEFYLKVSTGQIKHHGIGSKIIPVNITGMAKKPSF